MFRVPQCFFDALNCYWQIPIAEQDRWHYVMGGLLSEYLIRNLEQTSCFKLMVSAMILITSDNYASVYLEYCNSYGKDGILLSMCHLSHLNPNE